MIKVTVDDKAVRRLLASAPKAATRAAEQALDQTAWAIYRAIGAEINVVFNKPTPYTKKSLKVEKTKNHNMRASVWFKEPERMAEHYLVPQVEGTERKLKGFERGLYKNKFIPSKHLKLDRYGNVSAGTLRQILSALGRAELSGGYQANRTAKSATRNAKHRDYVFLPRGSRRGKLPPGVYLRVAAQFKGFNSPKTRRKMARQGLVGEFQTGKRKAVVRATGLRPVLIIGRQHAKTKPRLPFYEIAGRVYDLKFRAIFFARFNALVGKR